MTGSASRRIGASVASRASKKTPALIKALSGSFIVFGQDGGQNDRVANASIDIVPHVNVTAPSALRTHSASRFGVTIPLRSA
jgi:hypothetical protein